MPAPQLIDWRQTIELVGTTGATHEQVPYSALINPVLVVRDKMLRVLSQSGEAIVWFGKLKAPPPAFAGYLLDQPRVTFDRLDHMAWRTTWQYALAVDDAQWPGDAQFSAFVEQAAGWPTAVEFLP